MNASDVINEVKENASEYLEMTDNPTEMMVGILAQKVVNLTQHVEYLQKRLNHVSR